MTAALRTPERRFADLSDYPFAPHYFEIEGIRLHYVDEGTGPVVVLFHGEPTWSFLYRKMIPILVAAGYRTVAPDYAGFGKSDKPTDPAFYTYDRHVSLMAALFDALDLSDATAVVQDWGGPIGLRVAVEHPRRVRRLVVMNTGLFTGERPNEAFLRWRDFVERNPDLPVRFVMERSMATPWPEPVLEGYTAPFPTPEHKVGAQRFPLIVPLDSGDPGAREMRSTADALRRWPHPALVLFGAQDRIFPPSVGRRWVDLLPEAGPLRLVEGAGHFLQEDQGDTIARRIAAFLQATG